MTRLYFSATMEKSEFRVLIKHYFLRNKTIKQTEEKLQKYYGNQAPSHGMVHKWFSQFRCGRTSTNDSERSGRPAEEMVNKIHDIVLADRHVKVKEIAEMIRISDERIRNILHEHSGMRKLSMRWVPRLLTVDQKRNRVTTSKACLDMFKRNSSKKKVTLFPHLHHQSLQKIDYKLRRIYRNIPQKDSDN